MIREVEGILNVFFGGKAGARMGVGAGSGRVEGEPAAVVHLRSLSLPSVQNIGDMGAFELDGPEVRLWFRDDRSIEVAIEALKVARERLREMRSSDK